MIHFNDTSLAKIAYTHTPRVSKVAVHIYSFQVFKVENSEAAGFASIFKTPSLVLYINTCFKHLNLLNFNMIPNLVGGFNPFEKYARQIGSFPQGSG